MGTILRFLERPSASSSVLDWFRNLRTPPEITARSDGALLYFREFGPLHPAADGACDVKNSPLVNLFLPQLHRCVLHSVGEVHFLPTPAKAFPELAKVARNFQTWLSQHELVFDRRRSPATEFDHQLEGSVQNFDSPIYAFVSGWQELKAGRYFISHDESEHLVERICRSLKLRGVLCE